MPTKPTIPRICEHCGAPFLVLAARLKRRYPPRFCCRTCATEVRAAVRIECRCSYCGAALWRPPHILKRRSHVFCNLTCLGLWQRRPWQDHFWERVEKTDGCWFWRGRLNQHGYGTVDRTGEGVQSQHILAPRAAWELTYGEPPGDWFVLHRCEANYPPGDITYRQCVNPAHLYLGTLLDNTADLRASGRGSRGERRPNHKVTEAQVRMLRERHTQGVSLAALARELGLNPTTVRTIAYRFTWKHVA
jgi:hypothetical protein